MQTVVDLPPEQLFFLQCPLSLCRTSKWPGRQQRSMDSFFYLALCLHIHVGEHNAPIMFPPFSLSPIGFGVVEPMGTFLPLASTVYQGHFPSPTPHFSLHTKTGQNICASTYFRFGRTAVLVLSHILQSTPRPGLACGQSISVASRQQFMKYPG